MKRKHNEGFSLTEVLVSMAILTAIVIPVCTCIVLCTRIDARSQAVLNARIAVSSAVERLMAEGITSASDAYDIVQGEYGPEDQYPGVTVSTSQKISTDEYGQSVVRPEDSTYYIVEVTDDNELVTTTTCIRAVAPRNDEENGGANE